MFSSLFLAAAVVAQQPGYCTSLANHIARWLRQEGVSATVAAPGSMATALRNERVAFLVGFEKTSAAEISELKSFRSRGGKLVVFHSSSAALADLMGVKPLGFRAAAYPGEWSRMDFDVRGFEGMPSSVRQTSTVLNRAVPVKGRSRVLATWSDRAGKSTGEPAWIVSGAGFWMTHVLLADGDEDLKARLCASLVASVEPKSWSYAAHRAKAADEFNRLTALAKAQKRQNGELHAVWDHSGCGLYPGDWPRTMRILQAAHVTDLFVNVAGAGFAHYPSAVLPRSKTLGDEGDQLAAAVAAAKGTGIRVHAWILCFSATRAPSGVLNDYAKRGWRVKSSKGKLTEYVSPAIPGVRTMVLAAIDEIQARYPVAGIHLDFVRWGEGTVRPAGAVQAVSQFVAEARRHVKRPRWLTAAVYGKYPHCVSSVGQDWVAWLDMGLVDYVVPMDYTESPAKLTELLALQASSRYRARKTIVGIGVTANESRLGAKEVIEQLNLVRRYGFAGASLFDLDTTLEKNVLPYLKLGIW